ncbi:hypothetical protein QCA50_009939 [Cerrena zonata]|uniref:Uncharacterized protein n=1 Tax=Cerrena zonata TaxID=2478898 RepID=A0AAW0G0K1_9APHY
MPNDWSFIPSQADEYAVEDEEASNNRFKSFGYWVDENEVKIEESSQVEGTLIQPGAEKDAQPVFRERRSSATNASAPSKHKKFDDDDVPTCHRNT